MTRQTPSGMAAFMVTVYGVPVPQGSKRIGRAGGRPDGRPILLDDNRRTKPWRQAVIDAAMQTLDRAQVADMLDGPLRIEVLFTLPKPASTKRRWPFVKPDLDKLLRSTFDALRDAGVYRDDAQLVDVHASKRYPGAGALSLPGAFIAVFRLEVPGAQGTLVGRREAETLFNEGVTT